jgi:hypothetical protein
MTKKVITERKVIFKFYNPRDPERYNANANANANANFCMTRVKVKEMQYNENEEEIYYDISYKHKLNNKSQKCEASHPFFENMEDRKGEIIRKNSLTNKLVEYLLMSFEDLQKEIGQTAVLTYKLNIMKSISLLWD